MPPFRDRTDAGEQLAAAVREAGVDADVVLAVPRGGLPVGRAVADALGVPLDVVVARKVGAPGNRELALGAVASDGSVWLNDDVVASHSLTDDEVEELVARERRAAKRRVDAYRKGRPPLDVEGKTVLLVDDGVATGATTLACVEQLANAGAARVVVAVPVAPPGVVATLREAADDVVCVATPAVFGAVGRFYKDFGQVSDREAASYLDGGSGE